MVSDNKNNIIINKPLDFNGKIEFLGSNNVLFFENSASKLGKSKIAFRGNNSVIIIGHSPKDCTYDLQIYNDSAIFIGKNSGINNTLQIICSEAKNVFIGNGNLFSSNVVVRTGDAHRLYSIVDHKRINGGKSVFIGDHVWLAANVFLFKGTKIHSGSVIGAWSLLSKKNVFSNELWVGMPARCLNGNIFFDGKGSHGISADEEEMSLLATQQAVDNFIFENDETYIDFDILDQKIFSLKTSKEKFDYLKEFLGAAPKNRFAKIK